MDGQSRIADDQRLKKDASSIISQYMRMPRAGYRVIGLTFISAAMLALSLILHGAPLAGAYAGAAGPPPGSGINYVVTADSGKSVYVMWAEYDESRRDYSTWVRASHDGGYSFEKVIDLSSIIFGENRAAGSFLSSAYLGNIQMAASGSNLYVGWTGHGIVNKTSDSNENQTNNPNTADHAYFMKSSDGGHTFASPIILDPVDEAFMQGKQKSGIARNYGIEKLVTYGDMLYAIIEYSDNITGMYGGFLLRASNDAGKTFSDAVGIFRSPENGQPWIQVATSSDGKNVYMVAAGKDKFEGNVVIGAQGVLFRASNNGGESFGDVIDLNQGNDAAIFAPVIAASGKGNVYVAWSEMDPGNKNINHVYFRASNDSGRSFGEKVKLDTISQNSSEISSSYFPQVAANNNADNVYVKWWDVHFSPDMTEENKELLVRASHDAGKTFDDPVELDFEGEFSENNGANKTDQQHHISSIGQSEIVTAEISLNGTNADVIQDASVYVTWIANVGEYPDIESSKVFIRRSTDGGNTFDTGASLPQEDAMYPALNSRIAASGNNVYVAWDNGSPGIHGIYFAASNNSGRSFGSVINLVELPEQQVIPEFSSSTALLLATISISVIAIVSRQYLLKRSKQKAQK